MAGLQLELPSVRSPPKPLASLTPRRDYLAKTGAVHLVEEAIVALTAARPDDPRSFLAKYFAEDARESAKAGPADSDLRCLQLTAAENAAEVKRRGRRRRTRVLLLASAAHEPGAASRFVVGRQHGSVLTAHGDLQAHALGERLRKQGVRIGSAICSPQLRARRTAEIVLGHLETTPAVRAHPGARERSMGGLVGKPPRVGALSEGGARSLCRTCSFRTGWTPCRTTVCSGDPLVSVQRTASQGRATGTWSDGWPPLWTSY
eukprot:TRINITY_DN23116_c0_g1_i2.p1 TRINITY_DN23116_c0_g1~~TRINITY_DN23116_c0_g1_i2.p1  ORF type:complete len:261 (+),score=31.00 TRINITY_DN23116_c0_g1_i2:49-831(+)